MWFTLFYMFSSLLVSCFVSKHLLLILLSLDFIVISLYFCLFALVVSFYNYEYYFLMVLLTMSVCEWALGVSILVSMIRSYGNDYFQSFSISW